MTSWPGRPSRVPFPSRAPHPRSHTFLQTADPLARLGRRCLRLRPARHADSLVQLDNGVRIPPSGWKCSRCDLTENLWLNLTDGTLLCGRRNWDGSGGNGHALEVREDGAGWARERGKGGLGARGGGQGHLPVDRVLRAYRSFLFLVQSG